MKVTVKEVGEECTKLTMRLKSTDMQFVCVLPKIFSGKELKPSNECRIEFADSFEVDSFIKMLEELKKQSYDRLGHWQRM